MVYMLEMNSRYLFHGEKNSVKCTQKKILKSKRERESDAHRLSKQIICMVNLKRRKNEKQKLFKHSRQFLD